MEANPRYVSLADEVFSWLEVPGHAGVTSTVTMAELLVHPYRELEWVAPDLPIADLAARFRARHRLRTPDAIQAATAARSHATGLVANDPLFKRIEAFETLLLDDLA